jgi:hypothetical protein
MKTVAFEDRSMQVRDLPNALPIIAELEHAKRTIATLLFRSRPDVMGEDNFALIEYETGVARAAWNLLMPYSL